MTPTEPRHPQAFILADHVAAQMFARLRRRVPLDELQNLARLAAHEAADRWDGRGQFARFAAQRIRWAVLGAVRVRRRLGPRPAPDALQTAADIATERAADAAALEMDASAPVSFEALHQATALEASERIAAIRAFFGRAAASFAVELDAAGPDEVADPDIDLEREADRKRVRRAVESLPPDERAVVERHCYGNETFEEIAASLRERRSTVFSRYARALERLREMLGERRDPG